MTGFELLFVKGATLDMDFLAFRILNWLQRTVKRERNEVEGFLNEKKVFFINNSW